MNFENINSSLQEIWNSAPANFWLALFVLVIAILIFFLPVKMPVLGAYLGDKYSEFFCYDIWFLVSRINPSTCLASFSLIYIFSMEQMLVIIKACKYISKGLIALIFMEKRGVKLFRKMN
nr:hypothetical protein [Lactococcus petauri]